MLKITTTYFKIVNKNNDLESIVIQKYPIIKKSLFT